MKRFVLLLATAGVLTLLGGVAAYAASFHGAPASPRLMPLRGTGVVSGHVLGYDGNPLADVTVQGAARNDAGAFIWNASTKTDAEGAYSFSDAPATSGGRLIVNPAAGNSWFLKGLTFTDPGTTVVDLRPGRLQWTATRGGPFALDWTDASVELSGSLGDGVTFGTTTWKRDLPATSSVSGWAEAMPGTVSYGAFMFSETEAAVWDASDPGQTIVPVNVGETAATTLHFDQAAAHRIGFTTPFWASGPPGSKVTLGLENYPAGEQATFMGYSANESEATFTTWGDRVFTSTGLAKQNVALTVPKTAVPGLDYLVTAGGTTVHNGVYVFALTARFQVCTLKSTPATVKRGGSIRLSGVVPVAGNAEGRGTPKAVTIFARTKASAAAPAVWNAATAGWKKVGTARTNAAGVFRSGKLKPLKTTWYVVRYGPDADHRGAYTAVVKVKTK